MSNDRKKGFTLIELLVVIAIIALLLAVIMPALSKCKEAAKTVVCGAQIRQFGVAWTQYADENDGKNLEYSPVVIWDTGGLWFYRLGPYISADNSFTQGDENAKSDSGVVKLLNCPATKEWTSYYNDLNPKDFYGDAKMAWKWTGVAGTRDLQGGYTLNGWMQHHPTSSDNRFYNNFTDANGNVPLISDGGWIDAWPNISTDESVLIESTLIDTLGSGYSGTYRMPNGSSRLLLSRHGDGINIAFRDSHVEKIPLEQVWSLSWHKDFERVFDLKLPRSK